MQQKRHTKLRKPLDKDAISRLALHYVGRYATTQAKLTKYLQRKVRERGWEGDDAPDVDAVAARCVDLGYIDDAAFAGARVDVLSRRGYGARRIGSALHEAGIDRELVMSLMPDEAEAFAAAENFARRKRIGAFAPKEADRAVRERQFAAMLRAGHSFTLARRFVDAAPEDFPIRED